MFSFSLFSVCHKYYLNLILIEEVLKMSAEIPTFSQNKGQAGLSGRLFTFKVIII